MSAITYLLQVSGCTAVFYLFYYVLLNKLTFFTVNRCYLLATLCLSFVIPLLTIPVHQNVSYVQAIQPATFIVEPHNVVNTKAFVQKTAEPFINWMQVLRMAYFVVATGLLVQLTITLISFFSKLRGRKVQRVGGVYILHSNKKMSNGSFLNYIFLDDEALSPEEIQQVIAHEMLHVKLWHSVDRILVKVIQVILWFNPFVYLYARSVEENHEFEVDREIARSANKNKYADLLLHLSVGQRSLVYNNFSTVPLKKRITMLFNQPSTNMKKLIYVLVVPAVLISCLAFARFKKDNSRNYTIASKPNKSIKQSITNAKTNEKVNTPIIKVPGSLPAKAPDLDENRNAAPSALASKNDSTNRYSAIGDLKSLGTNPLVLIDGKEYPSDILYKIGRACIGGEGIFGIEGALKKYGERGKDGCVEIKTKKGQITYLTPVEKENLIKEASVPQSRFYTRLRLEKEDGSFHDKIIIHIGPTGAVSTDLSPEAKAGFLIDKTFYDEDGIKKVSPAIIASLTGEYGVRPSHPGVRQERDWAAVFEFKTYQKVTPAQHDTIKYGKAKSILPNTLGLTDGNLSAAEKENIAKENAVPKSAFLTRIQLKDENGKVYDEIVEHDKGGSTTMTLAHNAKAAFFVGKNFYTEEQMKKLGPQKIAAFKVGGVRNLNPKKTPDTDLHGYEVVFYWTNDARDAHGNNPAYPFELHLPAD